MLNSAKGSSKKMFFGNNSVTGYPPHGTFRNKNVTFGQKVGFSRPKTMATKISQKVLEYPTPPPYLGNIPKKCQFFWFLP